MARLSGRSPAGSLEARAIALLARREYSRVELRECLLADGAARDRVDELLDDLARRGYQSDERCAQALVRRKAASCSRRSLAEVLRAKGVGADAAAAALAELETDDVTTLAAVWQRRFGRVPGDERERARQVRFLQNRGFAVAEILRFLRALPVDPSSGDS